MVNRRRVRIILLVGGLGVLIAQTATAQVTPERLTAVGQMVERIKAFGQRLPAARRDALSSGALNLINLAERWDQIKPHLRQVTPGLGRIGPGAPALNGHEQAAAIEILAPKQVSNLSADVLSSRLAGFTQSETSTAWCGNNVVVGFNNSGGLLGSLLSSGGISINGVSRSTNKGDSFTDLGFLNPGPVITDFLAGDPALGCSDANTFYYASIFQRATTSDISVSKSFDGGQTFGDPVPAVSKDSAIHFLEKAWIAVDPTSLSRIYVTYTDFDDSGNLCGFDPVSGLSVSRTAVELVRSTNGGTSWGTPVVIDEVCGDVIVQGSQVAVGPGGEVYVAWETVAADFVTREIDIRKSADNGTTFGALVKVDNVICAGTCRRFQGNFRSGFEFPTLAVDRSGKSTNGSVYIAWNDGRNLTVSDAVVESYGYADILASRSTDGGATWFAPVRVNNNPEPLSSGLGTDQYQPGIAVDKTGKIGICFYDRRRDPKNFLIDRECAFSTNAGTGWSNKRITKQSFPAVPGQDVMFDPLYMGDYDSLASDFTRTKSGFIGAWGDNSLGNPDVKAEKF